MLALPFTWVSLSSLNQELVFMSLLSLFSSRRIGGTFWNAGSLTFQIRGIFFLKFPNNILRKWGKIFFWNLPSKIFPENSLRFNQDNKIQDRDYSSWEILARPWMYPRTLGSQVLYPTNWAICAWQSYSLCLLSISYVYYQYRIIETTYLKKIAVEGPRFEPGTTLPL